MRLSLHYETHSAKSMRLILADPNLVYTFLGNIFFDINYGAHP